MANDYFLRLSNVASEVVPFQAVARKGNRAVWPALKGVSIAQVEIPVGSWRGPHRHLNAPELAVIVQGQARAGLVTNDDKLVEVDLEVGDCVFFPTGWTHWLHNTGDVPVVTYFNYGHEQPVTEEVDTDKAKHR